MNHCFRTPVLLTRKGGKAQGGAYLTPFGEALIARYRAMEAKTQAVLSQHIEALEQELACETYAEATTATLSDKLNRA
jgi:molybdate transport system regulatory protein